jgi:glycosyltransferase involved in cell wall biosynthesis
VIDDGSTDDTAARLARYGDRLRYVYQANRGASAAQNAGIALARAPWLAILASDDIWMPTKLERQIAALHALGPGFGACFTDCQYVGEGAGEESAFARAGFTLAAEYAALETPLDVVLARHPALFVQSMLIRRDVLDRVGGFDERLLVGEDTDLLFRLALGTRLCVVRAPLVRVDRSPSVDRLSNLFLTRDDVVFESAERRYKKWLEHPQLTDSGVRHRLDRDLSELYYHWAISRLYAARPGRALSTMRKLRSRGVSPRQIASVLVSRARRRFLAPAQAK